MQQLKFVQLKMSDRDVLVEGNQSLARETENLELEPQIVALGVEHLMHHPELGQYWIAENDLRNPAMHDHNGMVGLA